MTTSNADETSAGRARVNPIVPKTASEALRPETGTPPPERTRSRHSRNRLVVFLNFLMSIVVAVVIIGGIAFFLAKREFEGPGPLAANDTVLIRPGSGLEGIANNLHRGGFISDPRIFAVGVRLQGQGGALKAGEYEVPAGASMHRIMEILAEGKSVLYSLTIPEGLTVEQALDRIARDPVLTGNLPAEKPAEGMLAADTQRFTRGMTREQMVRKMTTDQRILIEGIWNRRQPDLPLKNMNEFVTLASIVEKETGVADERPRVAAVFVNRLNKRMRLQSDPTIIYGLFGGKGKPADRPITRSDIDTPTPYNTYTINGLPPGPIANPGRDALEAVANPSRTEDLYFVADGTGGHAFASTLDEHNENVARWRRIEKERAAAGQPVDETPGTGVVPEE